MADPIRDQGWLTAYNPPPAPTIAPAPSAVPPAGAPTTGGQFVQPDWSSLLNTWMQPYQSMYNADISALQGRTDAQSQLAQNRFSQGDTSTLARLGDEHTTLARNIVNALAARGILQSGDRRFQTDRENLRYKRATTDASNQLLDYLTNLQSQLADAQRQGLFGLQNQRLQTAQTLSSMYQPYWQPGTDQGAVAGVPNYIPGVQAGVQVAY